ncbi:MAG: dockerin type I repeat-containing protein [Fidelibacterota bacterium]
MIWYRKISILILLATLSYSQDIILGDLNDDEDVNVIDIVDLVDIILGTEPDENQLESGDLNSDAELNIQDVVLIVEIILDILCPVYEDQCDPSALDCCTSHEVDFSVHTFGTFSSDIFDSWIFSDDYILAGGDITSAGQGTFSCAIWDSENWELAQIYEDTFNTVMPIRSIWAFSEEDIYLAAGSILHWNGNVDSLAHAVWIVEHEEYPDEAVFHIWAASESSIYFVGPSGCIRHFNGEEFIRMESGTDIWLKDVWGYVDPDTGAETVWACGWNYDLETVLLKFNDDTWYPVYNADEYAWELLPDHLSNIVISVWSTDEFLYVLTGNGLYQCVHQTTGEGTLILENEWFVDSRWQVRGLSDNDIFIVGHNQEIMHYNGENWQQLTNSPDDYLYNIEVKDGTVVAGGHRVEEAPVDRALLLHGVRNRP